MEKAFRDETKSFLQSKDASVALRKEKHLWTGFFNLKQDRTAVAELCPQGRNRYCSLPSYSPSKDLEWFFGLKRHAKLDSV